MSKVYPLKYRIELGEFTKEHLKNNDYGGTDALILHSIIYPEDGSRSEVIASKDGRTGEDLDDSEVFKSWVGMAKGLSESNTLGDGRRLFCKFVFETVRSAILDASEQVGKI